MTSTEKTIISEIKADAEKAIEKINFDYSHSAKMLLKRAINNCELLLQSATEIQNSESGMRENKISQLTILAAIKENRSNERLVQQLNNVLMYLESVKKEYPEFYCKKAVNYFECSTHKKNGVRGCTICPYFINR